MLSPHEIVRDAADLARHLAGQAMRAGEPDHAAYFEQVAAEADERAGRLLLIQRACQPRVSLHSWTRDLRARLDRGELATLPPIDFGDGAGELPADHTVRIMLADLDSFEDMDPDEARDPANVARRVSLLADFRALRFFID